MHDQASDRVMSRSPLMLLVRATASMSRVATTGLALLFVPLFVSLVGVLTDWKLQQSESTTDGVRSFQWVETDSVKPTCVGPACGMATLPMHTARQVGGAGSSKVTARILWPSPMVIDASPGTYLEAVGATDGLHPVVERPRNAQSEGDANNDTRPVLLANEVQRDGTSRPIMVPAEGFVSAWAVDGESAEQLTAWARPAEVDRRGYSRDASVERNRQWRSLKMRAVQFQPMPPVLEVDVLRAALLDPIQVGHVMVFDWQADGALQTIQSQLVPSRNVVGVVAQVQEMGQYLRVKVQVPRTSPYGTGHWLWHRLDGVASSAPALPNYVQAVYFAPGEMLGATPDWGLLERAFFSLPVGDVMRVLVSALDPTCAEPPALPHSCVWVMLHGVAVPVQVTAQPLAGGDVSLTEHAVFGGIALRAADWAMLPREVRSAYGRPSGLSSKPGRTLLDPKTNMLLAPQPWLKAGMPVSVAVSANRGAL